MQISMLDGTQPYKITKPIRLIELFAGIGAQAKALRNNGVSFKHYRTCEFDKYAVQSYNAIHGTNFATSDITKITAKDLGIADTNKYEYIMTYSFPCQDLSIAGKQAGMTKGSGTRSGLLWEVERLLSECSELPQVLLMENVPEVLNGDFGGWLEFLESKGYHNYYKRLNAKNYGIPQNRDRCFMVSLLGDYYYTFSEPKPVPKPVKLRLKDFLESEVDEKYYLSEKAIKGMASTTFNCSKIENRLAKNGIMPTLCARDYKDPKLVCEPQLLQVAQLNGFESTGRIYSANGLCPTINTMGGGGREPKIIQRALAYDEQNEYIHYDGTIGTLTTDGSSPKHNNRVIYTVDDCDDIDLDKPFEIISVKLKTRKIGAILQNGIVWFIRKLTPKECWRLMGFTDNDFYKAQTARVSNSQLYKQAGNSIVVPVLEAVFEKLF